MNRSAATPHDPHQRLFSETLWVVAGTAVLLIAAVAAAVYLGGAGLRFAIAAPAGFGLIAVIILRALPAHPYARFGLANIVTTVRAGLTVFIGALLFEAGRFAAPDLDLAWLATGTTALALTLDGLDGYVARTTRRSSAFGARFDMEIDALLLLLLCGLLWASGKTAVWIFAIGLMRYGFVLAGLCIPRLAGELADNRRRKAICVFQGIALCAALAPIVPAGPASAIALAALLTLIYSFSVDIATLLRSAR